MIRHTKGDEFIAEGLDFVSFGTNNLTQYTLAVDRNNEHVIIECNKAGVKTSISANIDAVETVRDMVARTELQLLLKGARERKS